MDFAHAQILLSDGLQWSWRLMNLTVTPKSIRSISPKSEG